MFRYRAVICQKQISVEGNGHCCHRPSSNWETNECFGYYDHINTIYLFEMPYPYFSIRPIDNQRGLIVITNKEGNDCFSSPLAVLPSRVDLPPAIPRPWQSQRQWHIHCLDQSRSPAADHRHRNDGNAISALLNLYSAARSSGRLEG